jgi:hypothetical protein
MRLLKALPLLCLLLAALPAAAQPIEPNRFASYEDMRATLDDLVSTRRIQDLLVAFGGADEMTTQDMSAVEGRVRLIFPNDFENAAVMIRQDMKNGFHQELIAYWTDLSYIYVRILWHERPEGGLVAINMTFNSDVDALMPLF